MLSNNPPIADRLAVENTDLLAEVDGLAKRANAAPREIRTDADLDEVARLVTDARAKAAEARRKAEEEAAKARAEAQRQREIAERASEAARVKAASRAEDRAGNAEARAEAADRIAAAPAADLIGQTTTASGATATGKTIWSYEVTDYDLIPLDLLRPYLKREHVEAAIKQFVKFHNSTKPLAGVRIFEDIRASIR